MDKHKIGALVVVVGLGVSLHTLTRGLSEELGRLFPQISRETPPPPLPEAPLITIKRSGEIAGQKKSSHPPPRVAQRLLKSTPIPPLPSLPHTDSRGLFSVPRELEVAVDFWKKIYAIYDTNRVVLHDTDYLQIQYGVLDFTALNGSQASDDEKKSFRDAEIARETDRIRSLLTDLSEGSQRADTEEAQRISSLFAGISDPDKFTKARDRIRTQTGLKNRFQEGLKRSGRYMPFFEQIFVGSGVPREVSRLVFVESLFNERSLSKVGAAGLWQFMPSTARLFMNVNSLVDERYDPIVSSYAAARLLLKNYKLLGSWPLAINAYNSGPGNLLRASERLGTRDIGTIITQYKSGSYSFASRNFYPSFLAALHIYENREKYFGRFEEEPLMTFDLIEIPATMSLSEIVSLADSSAQDIRELNPSFAPLAFDGNYYLPAGSQIRLPKGRQGANVARE